VPLPARVNAELRCLPGAGLRLTGDRAGSGDGWDQDVGRGGMALRRALAIAGILALLLLGQACSGPNRPRLGSSTNGARLGTSPRAGSPSPSEQAQRDGRTANLSTATATAGAGFIIADPKFEPLAGASALYGTLGGAAYEIEVPAAWNGSLVLYAHGFVGNDPILFVQTPPLRRYFIEHGFAWAASSYAGIGYDPDQGLVDTLALRNLFVQQVGPPTRTYMDGTSMGGHVVVSAMEQYPELFAGGLSECGVVAGVEELDYVASYVALGSFFSSSSLFPIADANTYRAAVRTNVLPALGSAADPSAAGQEFESVIKNLTGGERPWRHEGFADRRAANFDLAVIDDPQHPGIATRAGTNTAIQYHVDAGMGIDDRGLNAQVIRVPADPAARNAAQHPDFAPRTGRLQAPLLTLHTTGDHFVPISLEQSYRRTVDAAGAGELLVQRAIRRPGHCQFSQDELTRGFADLVAWVEQGIVPAGDDLRNPDLRDVGRGFTSPLLPGDPGHE
jgi:hypothetical protein